ncbi:E3 ubiquitin-protein ligase synoviolin [Zostera marina]|uniref:RING-type E3 ubiquitin transferase n=1 Tax=Zostera marina TaxID=29655 RepID=A0A0K9NZB8_ZOSMR|nr:E3 ubiquitin-protein ligase synoviolin [Zostera marina]
MMRLQTYAGISFLAAIAVIYHAFNSREQFYPAMLYLSTSNICLVLLLNMGFVIMCILWQLVKRIFLGSLREAEIERLNEQSWREVMEILFAITIFRQDFSVGFLGMVTALLLIKALHWLAHKRVEYIETTPTVTTLSHIRIVCFLGFLFLLDTIFLYNSVKSLVQTWQPSVMLFFSFEYMILATGTVSTFIKYTFYVSDMLMEGQWEKKAVYTFYLELVRDLLHLSMYLFFFLVIFMTYGVPLHLIREFYETFRNFKIRVADYLRYRNITSNMNDRFRDATPEELTASDATCIICREEMTVAKKLRCGHIFHVQCLRSWLERQHTCPTCRALVTPLDTTPAGSGHQHGVQTEQRLLGSQTTNASGQIPEGAATTTNLTPHEIRLQAAACAASMYQKSFVPLSDWTPGFSSPQTVDTSTSGQPSSSHVQPSNFVQVPQNSFPTSQSNTTQKIAQITIQGGLIRQQIEALQRQMQALQQRMPEETSLSTSDEKGKSSSVSDATSEHSSSSGVVNSLVDKF